MIRFGAPPGHPKDQHSYDCLYDEELKGRRRTDETGNQPAGNESADCKQ